MTQDKLPPLPDPGLVRGTKFVPYEERFFYTDGMAETLGYGYAIQNFFTADQMHAYAESALAASGVTQARADAERMEWLITHHFVQAWPEKYYAGDYTTLRGSTAIAVDSVCTNDVRKAIDAAIAKGKQS